MYVRENTNVNRKTISKSPLRPLFNSREIKCLREGYAASRSNGNKYLY